MILEQAATVISDGEDGEDLGGPLPPDLPAYPELESESTSDVQMVDPPAAAPSIAAAAFIADDVEELRRLVPNSIAHAEGIAAEAIKRRPAAKKRPAANIKKMPAAADDAKRCKSDSNCTLERKCERGRQFYQLSTLSEAGKKASLCCFSSKQFGSDEVAKAAASHIRDMFAEGLVSSKAEVSELKAA